MSAETLRRAAALMRERAEDADSVRGPGSWQIETAWCDLATSSYAVVSPGGTVAHGSCEEEAEHIASWHPAVARAVADLLENEASAWDAANREEFPTLHYNAARAWLLREVANAYLGGRP